MVDELGLDVEKTPEKKEVVNKSLENSKTTLSTYLLIIGSLGLVILAFFAANNYYNDTHKNNSTIMNESYNKGFIEGQINCINSTYQQLMYAAQTCKIVTLTNNISFVSSNCVMK